MPRQFAAAQIDEVELRLAAAALARSGGPGLPTTEELRRLGAARGVDMATAFFYEAVMRHPVHGAFARGIDARPALPCAEPSAVKVLVIPAWLYREHPEWGADGRLVKSVAGACGLACEVAETRSKGGVPENAEVVIDVLRRESCRDVWIVSYSKSVLEVRYAMEKYAADPALAKVRGWIAISANVGGSRLVDLVLAKPLRRAGASVLARLSGIPYEGLRELSTTHPFWRKPFVVPGGIEAISVVGAPLRCHVSRYVQRRFERLAPLGPNDGTCLLAEAFLSPGVVYPVWGADHFIRSPALSPLLYRLFRYVKSR